MEIPAEYVPYFVGVSVAVAVIFTSVILLGDWKEARVKRNAESKKQHFQIPQVESDDNL